MRFRSGAVARGGAYSCGFCIFEVPLGLGDREGRKRKWMATTFGAVARGGAYSCGFCIFEVPLGWGTGSGERGKWMATTYRTVVRPAVVVLMVSVFNKILSLQGFNLDLNLT